MHKGWDLWAEPAGGRSVKKASGDGKIIEVRDGNSKGYVNCLQVQYTSGKMKGYAEQIGHVLGGQKGIGKLKTGQTFKAGDEICECGTASDGQGISHFHVEYFDDPRHALAYDHSKAIDPAAMRRIIGERDVYKRPSSFGGGTASSTSNEPPEVLDGMDICCVAHD